MKSLKADPDRLWYVIRSNIKSEEKAMLNLLRAGYEVYLPRMRFETQNRRTKTYLVRERPLMTSYLFVSQPRINPDWYTLRACEGVESVLGDGRGFYLPVPYKLVEALYLDEIDMVHDDTRAARIHRKEEARTKKATMEMKYAAGRQVRVLDGPFADFFAEIESVTSAGRIKVLVSLFGRMSPVEFEAAQLSVEAA